VTQHYSNPNRANDPHALLDVETFRVPPHNTLFAEGWYWQTLPTVSNRDSKRGRYGQPVGPFASEAEAPADVQSADDTPSADPLDIIDGDENADDDLPHQEPNDEDTVDGCPEYDGPCSENHERAMLDKPMNEQSAGLPPCARYMGCLCAGHARGNPADEACDTDETTPDTCTVIMPDDRPCGRTFEDQERGDGCENAVVEHEYTPANEASEVQP